MYRIHYKVIRPHFSFAGPDTEETNRLHLCYCDMDSLVYDIRGLKGRSVYRDIYQLQRQHDIFDLFEMQDALSSGEKDEEC